MEYWLLLPHGMFGVGGLTGPFFVYFFGMSSFFVTSTIFLLAVPFIYWLPSSEDIPKHRSEEKQGEQHLR